MSCNSMNDSLSEIDCNDLLSNASSNVTNPRSPSFDDMTANESSPIISDVVMKDINIYGNILIRGCVALFGTISNTLSIIVFYKLGLKDSMSVGLIFLSFADFLVTLFGIAGTACFVWQTFFPETAIDPISFEFVIFGWPRDIAQQISGWITTYLSIERCVCVVSPFRVKRIFTRNRSAIAMAVIYMVHIAVHVPVFASQWLEWTTVDEVLGNRTIHKDRMVAILSDDRKQIEIYIDIVNGAVLPFPSQVLLLISVVWMIYGLRVSSRVRVSNSTNRKHVGENKNNKESKLTSRETRLIKVVLLMAIILTICNIPRFLAVYAKQIFVEVSIGRQYGNLYTLLWNLAAFIGIVNSSVNIFLYMIINRNYRATYKGMCC